MANAFIGLPIGTLTTLQTSYVDCLTAIASNQSYTLNGRTITRANLRDVQATLAMITSAMQVTNNQSASQTFVSFTGL